MRSLTYLNRNASRTVIANAQTTLPFPPTAFALTPTGWAAAFAAAVYPEFELELTGSTTIAVTNAVLYGLTPVPLTFADSAMTSGSAAANTITKVAHGFRTGDGPVRATGAGLPGGIALATDYWLIRVDNDTYKIAASLADALAGTGIDLSTNGTAMSIVVTADTTDRDGTSRVLWSTHDGLLGLAGDGAIALTIEKMYRKRVPHSPRVIAYALVADIDTGNVTAALVPVVDR